MTDLAVEQIDGGVVFGAKIVPGSSRTVLCGQLDGRLKIRVAASPEKGKANESLIEFLSEKLGVKKKQVSIIAGKINPVKKVQVLGTSAARLLKKLELEK